MRELIISLIYISVIAIFVIFPSDCQVTHLNTAFITPCYQSLSDPTMHVVLGIRFPTPPPYIVAHVEYNLEPESPEIDPIDDWAIHHLMLVETGCPYSIKFSDSGIKFKLLKIHITIYLGHNLHSEFTSFRYEFSSNTNFNLDRFVDVFQRSYMFVQFSHGNEPLQLAEEVPIATVMRELEKRNTEASHICVRTEDRELFIKPEFQEGPYSENQITAVTARVFQDKEEDSFISLTGFWCNSTTSYTPADVHFLANHWDDKSMLNFTISLVTTIYHLNEMSYKHLLRVVRFTTDDINPESIPATITPEIMKDAIFLMDLQKTYEECSGILEQYGYYLKDGRRVTGYRYIAVEDTPGVKRLEWTRVPGSKKCP